MMACYLYSARLLSNLIYLSQHPIGTKWEFPEIFYIYIQENILEVILIFIRLFLIFIDTVLAMGFYIRMGNSNDTTNPKTGVVIDMYIF